MKAIFMVRDRQPTTLIEAFEDYRGFIFKSFALKSIDARGRERKYSRDEIVDLVHHSAALLVDAGVKKADRVLLGMGDPAAFFVGFWSCQIVGAIVVPFKKPESDEAAEVMSHMITDCAPKLILVDAPVFPSEVNIEVRILDLDLQSTCSSTGLPDVTVLPEEIAVIQYTSGSTSNPKGCVLTHKAMLWNCNGIFSRSGGRAGETCVHWVPLHHDMGLMGGVLAPVVLKAQNVLIETRRFMTQPLSWVKELALHGTCHSSVSNFALSMVLKRASRLDLEANSLESVKNIFCGAEPIDARLVRDFNCALGRFGLRTDAIHPAYGLAEVTLMATSRKGGVLSKKLSVTSDLVEPANQEPAYEYVSVGKPLPGSQIRVIDDSGKEVSPGKVGEIAILTDSVMQGYWGNEKATNERIRDGWLLTGDLGALIDEELYITGRKSEVMIFAGRNVYPHDVERVIANAIEIDPHRVCAFSTRDKATETLFVVIEARGSKPDLNQVMNAKKACEAGMGVSPNILVCTGNSIPRTSSGKPRRKALAANYKSGDLHMVEVGGQSDQANESGPPFQFAAKRTN
jgi:fatty-acyl-CoA synthase